MTDWVQAVQRWFKKDADSMLNVDRHYILLIIINEKQEWKAVKLKKCQNKYSLRCLNRNIQ